MDPQEYIYQGCNTTVQVLLNLSQEQNRSKQMAMYAGL